MKSIRKSDIFLGGKASEWSPFLSKLSWGFYKGKIAFDSTQMLRKIDLVLNLLLNKVDNDKLHLYQKNNLMKCINWCEKFKIPANKFSQQINIFLSKNNKCTESIP